jgi:methyl-accepting chemotaxis protein-1 (serine sensor receptor)
VEEGSRLVGQAGETMNEVVASVQRVTSIIGEISIASGEQRDGIEQINIAISQMDSVTQQNAALVEEAAAAADACSSRRPIWRRRSASSSCRGAGRLAASRSRALQLAVGFCHRPFDAPQGRANGLSAGARSPIIPSSGVRRRGTA